MRQRDIGFAMATMLSGWLLGPGQAAAQTAEPSAPAKPDQPAAAAPAADKAAAPAAPATAAATGEAAAKPTAAKPGAAGGKPMPPGSSVKVERTATGGKLFRITEGMLVEGQMQRPNAFLVLQRATVEYDYEALSESFLPRILAAAREKPF